MVLVAKFAIANISVNQVYAAISRLLTKNRLNGISVIDVLPWYVKRGDLHLNSLGLKSVKEVNNARISTDQ